MADLVHAIEVRSADRPRTLVAIVGAPGAGKSTLAAQLAQSLEAAVVLPMDGFHLDNATLVARGLFDRKGAPETFDVEGFAALLHRVKAGGAVDVPTFDRARDCVVPAGARIAADARIVLVEGNYLLLDAPPWDALRKLWDMSVFLDVPMAELERRLIDRWIGHGLSPRDAAHRALSNDLPNAERVVSRSFPADMVVSHDPNVNDADRA